jgi:hypothetical protein
VNEVKHGEDRGGGRMGGWSADRSSPRMRLVNAEEEEEEEGSSIGPGRERRG